MVSKRGFGNSHPQQCIMVCFIFNFSFCFCFPKIDFTYNLGLSHIQLKCIKNIHEIKLLIGLRDFFSRITLKYLVNHVVVLRNIWNVNRCAFYITLKFFKKKSVSKIIIFFLEFEFIIFRPTICTWITPQMIFHNKSSEYSSFKITRFSQIFIYLFHPKLTTRNDGIQNLNDHYSTIIKMV